MKTQLVGTPVPEGTQRVCAFTLATALAWVGHDCTGGCPPVAATMRASVWFIRFATLRSNAAAETLVVIDLESASEPASVRAMLRQVNACAGADHICVRERVTVDDGRAVAVPRRPELER